MAAKRVPISVTTTVGDAINTAFSTIEDLASELREAYENTPESLQQSGAGEARGEAADTLENISEPDVPECAQELPVAFTHMPLPRRSSRSDRLADGLGYAYQAIEVIEERIEVLTKQQSDNDKDDSAVAETQEEIDALDSLRDEVTTMIEEAESVEFPGMFG